MKASDIKTEKKKTQRMGGGPGGGMAVGGERARDFKGAFKQLVEYLGQYRVAVVIVMIFAAISTVFFIVGPRILGQATTQIFSDIMGMIDGTRSGINFDALGHILLTLILLYGISAVFSYFEGLLMSRVAVQVTYKMRKDITSKINKLPLSYFDKRSYGEVLSLITNDVDVITQSLNQSVTQIITSITTVVGILIMMFSMNWQITLIAVAIIPVSMLFVTFMVRRSQKYFTQQQDSLGNVNGHISEAYSNHIVTKAFNQEDESVRVFDGMNEQLYESAWKSQFLSGMMMPIMSLIGNLGYVGICILGGWLVIQGSISVGDIQAFIQYVRQFTRPLQQIANISNVLQQTMAAAERIFDFLDEDEESPEPLEPAQTNDVLGAVRFDHVKFGYLEDDIILNDFSAEIAPGQKVAIVGPTGAGKTTIVKILMRFYDLNGGTISIDGADIATYTRDDLRSMFGMVLQDTWLFNGTIRENIRYGRLAATDEDVYAAAEAAQVDHFIRTMPEGYDTVIDEEASNLSQGQKQLITIARVILADPQMLILDEATSSVDTRTEVLIQKAMDNLMEGRTSFVIAHRLSTIRNSDVIFVLENGDIIEQGTHKQLLAEDGFYADLYNSQFEQTEAV